eukprot:COSAG02_NODE_82_length_39723_cov_247.146650_9_plen_183_part_00
MWLHLQEQVTSYYKQDRLFDESSEDARAAESELRIQRSCVTVRVVVVLVGCAPPAPWFLRQLGPHSAEPMEAWAMDNEGSEALSGAVTDGMAGSSPDDDEDASLQMAVAPDEGVVDHVRQSCSSVLSLACRVESPSSSNSVATENNIVSPFSFQLHGLLISGVFCRCCNGKCRPRRSGCRWS